MPLLIPQQESSNNQNILKVDTYKSKGLQRKFDSSWDFRGVDTKPYTHICHQYPAMFIPQVARRLIEKYSTRGDTLCDIFCGSGTALVESTLIGRNAIGIDLNPFAIFLARVKTTPIKPALLESAFLEVLQKFKHLKNTEVHAPEFFNIHYWFKSKQIRDLAKLKRVIDQVNDKKVRDFLLVSFSHTVRAASNTRGGEFKLFRISQEKLSMHDPHVIDIFSRKTKENINGMVSFYNDATFAKVTLIEGDSTKDNGIPDETIDLIITSPPYGDSRTTVAYGQFSRLSMQWLGLISDDRLQIDNEMLGGKVNKVKLDSLRSTHLRHIINQIRSLEEKRALEVQSFFVDLDKAMERAYSILKRGRYFCLVIGNRTVKNVRIPTDFIIAELGETMGFEPLEILVRNIPNKRMPRRNSPTNKVGVVSETMNNESIVILRKH